MPSLSTRRSSTVLLGFVLWALVVISCRGPFDRPSPSPEAEIRTATEWPSYGGDPGGLRYSPLNGIGRHNVDGLEVAWVYHHGDVADRDHPLGVSAFQATPIVVDGMLYFSTPFGRVVALDPATGAEHWAYDHELDQNGRFVFLASRGVSYWRGDHPDANRCAARVFVGTRDAFLVALDARSGSLCEDFGEGGRIDLSGGAGPELWRGEYGVTSPPAVVGDAIVVGSLILDNVRVDAPSGVVRAFDARTGALRWAWDLAPPGFDHRTRPVTRDGYALGTPNVWAPMSVDVSRDLVFVPTGNPAPDFWRGTAPDMDYYGSSVVALRGTTGEVVWHFQTVHHDLWDYDVPAQPTLVDLQVEGRIRPALVQGTKMGLLFVLDRETGEPIFPIEERPVPRGAPPGEFVAPTQPFPVKPPPLGPLAFTASDVGGLTFWDRRSCRSRLAEIRNDGIYTPPSLEGSLLYPATTGGVNWGGVSIDPERQWLVVNTNEIVAEVTRLVPAGEAEKPPVEAYDPMRAPLYGTPYRLVKESLLSAFGLPCNGLPLGRLTAIDLRSGEFIWQRPFGTLRDITPLPFAIDLGLPSYGGSLITGSGLVFIGAALGPYLRAFDIESGDELWRGRLPAGGQATPITYRVDSDTAAPRQFVVIAAGGHYLFHEGMDRALGDALVAFSIPATDPPNP